MTEEKTMAHILIVDDEASMREMLAIMLQREGYAVATAEDGARGLALIKETRFDLVISDIQMPNLSGIELLKEINRLELGVLVMMITAYSSTEEAVEAMKLGAYDYITKPFKNDEIRLVIRNALERNHLQRENLELKKTLGERWSFDRLVGKSPAMKQVVSLLERIAPSEANVLIMGESGTGKELVAQSLHYHSGRKRQPFIPINCGAIPENLLESELFGHERGAFTGADKRKEGLFESANGGTLFLDEIGELPMAMQVKLLRVLQEREFRRVGGTKTLPLDIRLLAATNRDLEEAVQAGEFREDLYYRINVVGVVLPPLRERQADIPLLINHFCQQRTGQSEMPLSAEVLNCLLDYTWPGNIRELENFVERCIVLGWEGQVTNDSLPPNMVSRAKRADSCQLVVPEEGFELEKWLEDAERTLLLDALEKSGGVRKKAAELLGISFRSIRYRLSKLGLGEEEASDPAK